MIAAVPELTFSKADASIALQIEPVRPVQNPGVVVRWQVGKRSPNRL
ncbi:MAG: hypothetical protein ACP5D7_25665 [Limnospira sp.]